VSIEKAGYATVERTVSGVVIQVSALTITPPPIRIEQRLIPVAAVPAGMVFVGGGDYRLISWSRPTDRRARLDDYFIDRYEVSNQEYKEFVSAGGYVPARVLEGAVRQGWPARRLGRRHAHARRSDGTAGPADLVEPGLR
jgi:formylglycine-generating enzyme required for sulfatase activity